MVDSGASLSYTFVPLLLTIVLIFNIPLLSFMVSEVSFTVKMLCLLRNTFPYDAVDCRHVGTFIGKTMWYLKDQNEALYVIYPRHSVVAKYCEF